MNKLNQVNNVNNNLVQNTTSNMMPFTCMPNRSFLRAAGLSTFIWLLMASDMSCLVLGSVEPEKHNKEKK
jgi:hypothetical protein